MVPGAGLFNGVRGLMTGQFGPSYSGYQGQVNTPGFADPTNRALQVPDGGQPMTRTQGAGLYRGAVNMRQQMFMPKPAAAPIQAGPQFQQSLAPSQMFSTGGQYGASAFRPGYSFWGGA
jgi:hypothetical protein